MASETGVGKGVGGAGILKIVVHTASFSQYDKKTLDRSKQLNLYLEG